DVLGWPLARQLGLPFLIEVHGYLRPPEDRRIRLYERLDQWVLRQADAVLVLSRDYEAEVRGYGVRPARLWRGPRGTGVAQLRAQAGRRDLRQELGLATPDAGSGRPPVVFGMVARLSAEKGHRDFLAALATLRARGHAVRGVLFGDGPLRAELAAQAAAL